eukprot:5194847-Pleurochrysis_carterae.AAC.1
MHALQATSALARVLRDGSIRANSGGAAMPFERSWQRSTDGHGSGAVDALLPSTRMVTRSRSRRAAPFSIR